MAKSRKNDAVNSAGNGAQKSFLSGVMVLGVSTVLVKIIGMLYKIPMLHILGGEGMGYYNAAYEIYALFFVISTAGLPVALSMMISQSVAQNRLRNVKKIYRTAFLLFFLLGLSGTLFLYGGGRMLSGWIANPGAYLSILAISPALFFVSVSGILRGYFQGFQSMTPTAVSQLIESVGKLAFGLAFAIPAIRAGKSMPTVAMWAVLGLVLGMVLSTLYMWLSKITFDRSALNVLPDGEGPTDSLTRIVRQMLSLAVPITVSASIMSLVRLLDMGMILRRLQDIGYDAQLANVIYGHYSTMAIPIYALPAALVNAIALPLVPILSSCLERGDRGEARDVVGSALRIASLLAIPCSFGITVFSKPILNMIFASQSNAIAYTAPLLSLLGCSVFFSCMTTVTNAVLQAYGRVGRPIVSILCGALIKILLAYLWIGNPRFHVYGAPLSTLVCQLTIVCMNMYGIAREAETTGTILVDMGKGLLASFGAVAVGMMAYGLLLRSAISPTLSLLVAVATAGMAFLVLAVKGGALHAEDLAFLPFGERLQSCISKKTKADKQHGKS